MKKRYAIFLALTIIFGISHAQESSTQESSAQESSWLQACKLKLAVGLVTAMQAVIEIAATQLAQQGDIVAAEILYDIQKNKTPQALFCEAGTMQLTGMFNHLISSLAVAQPIKTAIEGALSSAIYKAMETYSASWF